MSMRVMLMLAPALAFAAGALADDPPEPLHQPSTCTLPGVAISLCARITDDVEVAKARVYFRRSGDKFYSFVDMAFEGLGYCATLPAPRAGKVQTIEYYIQAFDNAYQSKRTSTYLLQVVADGTCEFPPVEKDPARAASIVVHATNQKQGRKLPEPFVDTGVSFVPVGTQ